MIMIKVLENSETLSHNKTHRLLVAGRRIVNAQEVRLMKMMDNIEI